MSEGTEGASDELPPRELVIAYLSYALDDVQRLSKTGVHLLQLAIASLKDADEIGENSVQPVAHSQH